MSDSSDNLPRWVTRPDGRLVPFDPDRIQRTLFAASEQLGQPDPFLARELTDSVLHFLAAEGHDPIASTQIQELTIKVVRELGQPALAQVLAEPPLPAAPPAAATWPRPLEEVKDPLRLRRELAIPVLEEYSLRSLYGPEVAAAHHEGLLILTGLEHPFELSAGVIDVSGRLPQVLHDARGRFGHAVVLDAPEFMLLERSSPDDLVRDLSLGLAVQGLRGVVNLNSLTPPRGVEPAVDWPLFAGQGRSHDRSQLECLADRLLDQLSVLAEVRMDWHLTERDFRADRTARLLTTARQAAEGRAIAFVFDRPRTTPVLAEGIDRRHPAVLLYVGLNLPQLMARTGGQDAERFLGKLGSLGRLAISAAAQKRDFLRRHRPALSGGFLLDRARLVVVPVGLEPTANVFTAADARLEFAGRIIQELVQAIERECVRRQLESTVDSPGLGLLEGEGVTISAATPRQQVRSAGVLQAVTGSGTARLVSPQRLAADEVVDLLRYTWQHTNVVRLELCRPANTAPATTWASDAS